MCIRDRTVSYFLRAAKMYDTLMQMGRWFGYRPGYLDLCRMYMTDDLREWFQHITETTVFSLDERTLRENLATLESFVQRLGSGYRENPAQERPEGRTERWE